MTPLPGWKPGVEAGALIGQNTLPALKAVTDWLCVQVGGAFTERVEVFLRTGWVLQRLTQPARGAVATGIGLYR